MPRIDLDPHLQHVIVHDLGWRSLRPVQEMTAIARCWMSLLRAEGGGREDYE